jgi:hypothetical protein
MAFIKLELGFGSLHATRTGDVNLKIRTRMSLVEMIAPPSLIQPQQLLGQSKDIVPIK